MCHIRKSFASSTSSHLNTGASEQREQMFKGEIDIGPPDFFLHPPRTGLRGHAYRTRKGKAVIDEEAVQFLCVLRNSGTRYWHL